MAAAVKEMALRLSVMVSKMGSGGLERRLDTGRDSARNPATQPAMSIERRDKLWYH